MPAIVIRGPSSPEFERIAKELNQAIDAIVTLVNDIRSRVKGNFVTTRPGLAIGSTVQNVATVAFDFVIAGVGYTKAAVAAGTALAGSAIPQAKYGAFRLEIGTNGTIDIVAATANATGYASADLALAGLPDVQASHAEVGTVTITKSDGAFTPGTTALNATNVTAVYADTQTAFEAIGAAINI